MTPSIKKALDANPTLLMIVLVVIVAAVRVSPGLLAELPAVFIDKVRVVPDTVKVVPAAMLPAVVKSTRYIPFTSPVALLTVIEPAPEAKTEENLVTKGVSAAHFM